jgi:mannose-1-phosphate guanylyltransferase
MKTYATNQTRYAIILAGGDGTRLSEVTRRISGYATPKQFCPVIGDTSLLEQTRLRVSLVVGENRILTLLNRAHERHYRDLLNEVPPENLLIQPANRGTAPAILYALMRLSKVARNAYVALFPSDHFVSNDHKFMRHVDLAFDAIEARPEMTALLGLTPHVVESGYGWIEPGELVANRSRCSACAGFGKSLLASSLANCCVQVACGTAS